MYGGRRPYWYEHNIMEKRITFMPLTRLLYFCKVQMYLVINIEVIDLYIALF